MEPSAEIKDLIESAKIIQSSSDQEARQEAGEKIVKAQADNLWTIGTVGLGASPVIVDENLKNVSPKGMWVFDISFMTPLYPAQFYFDE